jgi:hypothetical protein
MAIKIDEAKVKNGNAMRVYNQARKTNANKYYWFTYVQLPNGDEIPIMLTEKQFEDAKQRAAKNAEDVPSKNFLTDLLD